MIDNIDFFYPTMNVTIGNYSFNEGILFDVYSAKESYFDWAKVTFTEKITEIINMNRMDRVHIELGYLEDTRTIFRGYVDKSLKKEINCKDEMLKLQQIRITETFLNTDPVEIIMYGLAKAGVADMRMPLKNFIRKPKFSVANKNIIELINLVHQAWGINERFFFTPEGTFCWGVLPEQSQVYEFEYGLNVMTLEYDEGLWVLTTVAAPFIRHSQKIAVVHPKVSGEFEAEKVHYYVTEKGFPRTEIYFKGAV